MTLRLIQPHASIISELLSEDPHCLDYTLATICVGLPFDKENQILQSYVYYFAIQRKEADTNDDARNAAIIWSLYRAQNEKTKIHERLLEFAMRNFIVPSKQNLETKQITAGLSRDIVEIDDKYILVIEIMSPYQYVYPAMTYMFSHYGDDWIPFEKLGVIDEDRSCYIVKILGEKIFNAALLREFANNNDVLSDIFMDIRNTILKNFPTEWFKILRSMCISMIGTTNVDVLQTNDEIFNSLQNLKDKNAWFGGRAPSEVFSTFSPLFTKRIYILFDSNTDIDKTPFRPGYPIQDSGYLDSGRVNNLKDAVIEQKKAELEKAATEQINVIEQKKTDLEELALDLDGINDELIQKKAEILMEQQKLDKLKTEILMEKQQLDKLKADANEAGILLRKSSAGASIRAIPSISAGKKIVTPHVIQLMKLLKQFPQPREICSGTPEIIELARELNSNIQSNFAKEVMADTTPTDSSVALMRAYRNLVSTMEQIQRQISPQILCLAPMKQICEHIQAANEIFSGSEFASILSLRSCIQQVQIESILHKMLQNMLEKDDTDTVIPKTREISKILFTVEENTKDRDVLDGKDLLQLIIGD